MKKVKKKRFDCVEVKRRAQLELLKELEGHSPKEQYEIIRRLASELPLWTELRNGPPKTAPRSAKGSAKRRKAS